MKALGEEYMVDRKSNEHLDGVLEATCVLKTFIIISEEAIYVIQFNLD